MRKLLFITLIFGLISCEKEKSEDMSYKQKPSKITETTKKGTTTSYYSYDEDNPTIIETNNQNIVFEYESNKVIKKNIFRKGDHIPWLIVGYDYNTENKVIKVSFNINVNSTVEKWIGDKIDSYRLSAYYGYNYDGNKIIKEYYYDNNSKDTLNYNIITYDSNNNINSKTEYSYLGDQYVKSRVHKYTYDQKHHFYRNVNFPAYGSIFSIVNNILSEERIDYYNSWDNQTGITVNDSSKTIKSYTYEYNEFDSPTSIISDDETLKIEYK